MRPSVVAVSLGMLAACGGLVYMQATRQSPDTASVATAPAAPTAQQTQTTSATETAQSTNTTASAVVASASNADDPATAPQAARPDTVEQWIKDTQSSDPKIRAAAIAKLGSAPKAQALPVLKNVLESGEPEVDRHIALNSLHTLALRDGDKNGQVRDVMRSAIYHSDNDGVMQTAQSLLDDVEAALAEQQQ
ncbi:MAG TPA: HEAT repeat domain-containing protein [Povalibacter sp.]